MFSFLSSKKDKSKKVNNKKKISKEQKKDKSNKNINDFEIDLNSLNKHGKKNTIARVLSEKNKAEKRIRQKKQGAIQDIKSSAIYRSRMANELELLEDLFQEDTNIQGFVITVADEDIIPFLHTIHEEEMSVYDITQVDANSFEIAKKSILM